MKGIQLAGNREHVTIGVGETWGSVYTELQKHSLTAPGGRVGRVGVPGLILGGEYSRHRSQQSPDLYLGGLSFYSTKHGFACDSVVDFEVVLASGDVVHANTKENTDLFSSLKGGLNNFGIVTSFSMRTIPSSEIWGGVAYYMPDSFGQLLEATVEFVNNATDEDTHIMSSAGYGFGQDVCTCCMYHLKGDKEAPALEPFRSLPGFFESYSTLRTGDHMNFCNELSNFTQDGIR
jgi:FAD/FMN-containing dehydrogenase